MDLQLGGRVAIVTGGSRGIGKATARQLAREGANVVLVARGQEALDAAAAEIAAESSRRVLPIAADTSQDDSVRAMVERAAGELGRIDILVNCAAQPAGGAPPPRLAAITDDVFFSDMNVKVMGYLRCAREVAPHMVQQGWGRIISVSGLAARLSGNLVGSIRNVALVAMTKNLADELGPKGVNVTCVHPALTRTERIPAMLAARAAREGISEAEAERRMAEPSAIGRLIDASEVADVIAFLASPRSVAISGDVIPVGGGWGGGIYY